MSTDTAFVNAGSAISEALEVFTDYVINEGKKGTADDKTR